MELLQNNRLLTCTNIPQGLRLKYRVVSSLLICRSLMVVKMGEWSWLKGTDRRFDFICLSLAIMQWTCEDRSFFVEVYFLNAHSSIAMQCAFYLRFTFPPHGHVLERYKFQRSSPETSALGPHQCVVHHISRIGNIGSYLFQDNGCAATVDSECYLHVLQDFFPASPRGSAIRGNMVSTR